MSPPAFVGRQREMETLRAMAARAAGGTPQVALIEADAGLGKTALLRALQAPLEPFTIVRAEAEDGAETEPMWLIEQLVPDDAPSSFAAGMALLARLADLQAKAPVVLIVEDLHWCDAASRAALLTSMRRLQPGDRVLGLLTTRPDALDPEWHRLLADGERCTRIGLGPLTVGDVAALAREHGVAMSLQGAQALHEHTAGHPLYVRTLLGELSAEQLAAPGPLPAPRSFAASTVARVASLPPAATELVAALAVLGGTATQEELAAVADVGDAAVAVAAVLRTGIVEDRGPALTFAHPLYRTAVYDDLSPTRRRTLHLTAAGVAADPLDALWHRTSAADRTDEALAAELESAVTSSTSLRDTIRLLTAAADLSPDRADASRRVLRAARTAVDAGDVVTVRRLHPRVATCPQSSERDLVVGWLAWQDGDTATAERFLEAAASGSATEAGTRAQARLQLGAILALNSRGAEAIAAAQAALADGELSEAQRDQALLTVVRGTGQAEGGVCGLERLAELFPDPWLDPNEVAPQLLRVRGMLNLFAARPDEAVRWFDIAIGSARSTELTGYLAHMHMMRAQCRHWLGSWDDALVDARRAIELAADLDQRWTMPQARALAARLEAAQGRPQSADTHLAEIDEVSGATAGFETVMLVRSAHAEAARARGDAGGVIEALEPIFGGLGERVPPADFLQYWPAYVDALIDAGDLAVAARSADAYVGAAERRRFDAGAQAAAFRGRFAAAQGRAADAVAAFDEATALAGPHMNLLDRALLFHRHGRLVRSVGQRQRAVELLQHSRDLLAGARAVPYLQPVEHDLIEAGQAAAEPARRSRFDLTDRERDVAGLVARGHTNKEVAAELYVSTKAVEYHLGNIFAKLGIDNRRQLRDALAAA